MSLKLAFLMLLGLSSSLAQAEIKIDTPWAREMPPSSKVTAIYFRVKNLSPSGETLLSVTSRDGIAEIHNTTMVDGMMEMSPVSSLKIPGKTSVALSPNGLHIMMMNLKKAYKEGDHISLTLNFKDSGKLELNVPVKKK